MEVSARRKMLTYMPFWRHDERWQSKRRARCGRGGSGPDDVVVVGEAETENFS
jgi:hypothetical protein